MPPNIEPDKGSVELIGGALDGLVVQLDVRKVEFIGNTGRGKNWTYRLTRRKTPNADRVFEWVGVEITGGIP
jgi:hypothetical protein